MTWSYDSLMRSITSAILAGVILVQVCSTYRCRFSNPVMPWGSTSVWNLRPCLAIHFVLGTFPLPYLSMTTLLEHSVTKPKRIHIYAKTVVISMQLISLGQKIGLDFRIQTEKIFGPCTFFSAKICILLTVPQKSGQWYLLIHIRLAAVALLSHSTYNLAITFLKNFYLHRIMF